MSTGPDHDHDHRYAGTTTSMQVDPEATPSSGAASESFPGPSAVVGRKAHRLLEQPWRRVKNPREIPHPLTVDALDDLDEVAFAELLRDHLVPRRPSGPERERWDELWRLLLVDDDLGDEAFDVLGQFLDDATAALDDGGLDDVQHKRAKHFQHMVRDARARLEGRDRPLAWAGAAATGFNGPARRVIDQLVTAIDAHRERVGARRPGVGEADADLWQVLATVGLDPRRY